MYNQQGIAKRTVAVKRFRLQQVGINVEVVGGLRKIVHQHFQLCQIPYHLAAQHCASQRATEEGAVVLYHLLSKGNDYYEMKKLHAIAYVSLQLLTYVTLKVIMVIYLTLTYVSCSWVNDTWSRVVAAQMAFWRESHKGSRTSKVTYSRY